ncbi:helix-turn-helix domain-containing protein [Paenibacillus sp. P26]|nr:helix-turn-helix domain-containing protein [Paenibacillus sp. P26]
MRTNRGPLQIFAALLIVIVIMFASNYIVYRNSISGIYDQVSENNRLVVQNMIRAFDESFKDITDVIHSTEMLPYNAWAHIDSGDLDMHDAYMMQKEIGTLISSIEYIEDVVVFNNKSELAITSQGTIHLQELFRQKYRHTAYNLDFWKSVSGAKHPLRVFPEQAYGMGEDSVHTRKLLAIMGNNQLSDSNILVFVDADKLLRQVNQSAMMKGTSLTVLDEERRVILSTEEQWDFVKLLNEMNAAMAKPNATVKEKDEEYSFFRSGYNGFLYIHKAPYEFADIQSVTSANRTIMLISILCAVLISVLLSLYLYKPVKAILRLVGGAEPEGNDFRSILSGIMRIQKENESFKTQIDVIRAEMRKSALLQALDEAGHSREAELRMQQYFSDFFQETYFLMAVFQLHPDNEAGQETCFPVDELRESLEHALRERLGGAVVFYTSHLRFLALIGISEPSARDRAAVQLRRFIREAKNGAWKGCRVTVAVSRLYPSKTENCRKAYQDLNDALVYRTLHAEEPLIDIEAIRFNWKLYFPLDEIEKLANCLAGGSLEECEQIIGAMIAENAERKVHHRHIAAVADAIYCHLIKQLEPGDIGPQAMLELEKAFRFQVEGASHAESIRDALIHAVRFIARNSTLAPKSKLSPAVIAQYIESHYMVNLHLDHMAEKYETSAKYFSNYFKKAFGVNFVDYLNKVRLSHAKESLKHTERSVAEISESTGYLNSSTFTSTFKKYYGISPTEYRKNTSADELSVRRKKS